MTNLLSVDLNQPLSDVVRLMFQKNMSHVPVQKDQEIIGLISKTTVMDHLIGVLFSAPKTSIEKLLCDTPASQVMSTPITEVEKKMGSFPVLEKIIEDKVSSVVVTEGVKQSLFTKTDLAFALFDYLEEKDLSKDFEVFLSQWSRVD